MKIWKNYSNHEKKKKINEFLKNINFQLLSHIKSDYVGSILSIPENDVI